MKIFADDRISDETGAANPDCPHCQMQTPMTPVSRPDFAAIKACKPAVTGLSFLCLKCHNPLLVRYAVIEIGETEIKLGVSTQPTPRSDDPINLSYLPAAVKKPYVDALGCYQHELLQPFAIMCKQTMQAIIKDLGDGGKMRVFNHMEELRNIFDIEARTFDTISDTLFDNKHSLVSKPVFGRTDAAVLLEAIKDLLYQLYVREARLQRAIGMRRFFAQPTVSKSERASVSALHKPG